MKRLFVIGLSIAAILSACNRDEIIEMNEETSISFENAFVENLTKTNGETVSTGITEFYIHGIFGKGNEYGTVFDNQRVFYGANPDPAAPAIESWIWQYSPIQYWYQGFTYWFKAINLPVGENAYDLKMQKIDPKTDPEGWKTRTAFTFSNVGGNRVSSGTASHVAGAGENDLVYTTHSTTVNGNPGKINLNFKHALARIRFAFQNNMASVYQIKVSEITLNKAIKTGVFTLNETGSWAVADPDQYLTLSLSDAAIWKDNKIERYEVKSGETGISGVKYLIPGNPETSTGDILQYDMSFKLEVILDGVTVLSKTYTSTLPLIDGGLKQAVSYQYTASISNSTLKLDDIDFQVTSTENWGEWNNATIIVK